MSSDFKPVNRVVVRGHTVDLYVRFLNPLGESVNADDIPKVEIRDSGETVRQSLTNIGISLADDPGLYRFSYEVPLTAPDGYWLDRWVAVIGNETVEHEFEFQVLSAGSMEEALAPEHEPGDDFDFNFTKEEVCNINKLLKILKKRLKSDGLVKVRDGAGYVTESCPIFSDNELICFLINSLSEFNQTPHFTKFTFSDDQFCMQFADILIQGAVILALAAQALIEKGREFVITDNGVSYQPPAVSEILNSQYTTQMTAYREKLKFIKVNMKPGPMGLGTFRVTSVNPNFLRLRHLRARQIL